MFCPKCGNQNGEGANFCRKCGDNLDSPLPAHVKTSSTSKNVGGGGLIKAEPKDPDELTASGVCNVIIGDGFFMVAVLLSAAHSSVSSILWLLLLIPAFFLFGKGFADVLHARQIRRRRKESELDGEPGSPELTPPQFPGVASVSKQTSGRLAGMASVTERTTRNLV